MLKKNLKPSNSQTKKDIVKNSKKGIAMCETMYKIYFNPNTEKAEIQTRTICGIKNHSSRKIYSSYMKPIICSL